MQTPLTEIAVSIIAVCVVLIAVFITWAAFSLRSLSARMGETLQYLAFLRPKLERVLDETDAELRQLRSLTSSSERVAEHAVQITGELQRTVVPALIQVRNLNATMKYVGAAVIGAKAGMAALRRQPEDMEESHERTGNGAGSRI